MSSHKVPTDSVENRILPTAIGGRLFSRSRGRTGVYWKRRCADCGGTVFHNECFTVEVLDK